MSGKTGGQLAYEEWARVVEGIHATGWHGLDDEDRDVWETVAGTAEPALVTLRSQVDYFRELVAEILGHLDTAGIIVDGELRTAWSERAGLTPAIVGAGTEHIAAELAREDGDHDSCGPAL